MAPPLHSALDRRRVILGLAALAAGGMLPGCEASSSSAPGGASLASPGGSHQADAKPIMDPNHHFARMPAVFLPHGGGPWPFIDESTFGGAGMWDNLRGYLKGLGSLPPAQPRAILLISAHWEAPTFTVQTAPHPPLLYDYSGFPAESYQLKWPAPGAPDVAAEIRRLLESAGVRTAEQPARGFDHGVFVPLKLAYPLADIPTLQLSLKSGLDPREHLAAGQALAPLRDHGVFIVGSGMSYHNMRAFGDHMRGRANSMADDSKAFDDWLAQAMTEDGAARNASLAQWEHAPAARACHPREEHLIPLMMVAGSAANERGSIPYRDSLMGAHVSAVHFG